MVNFAATAWPLLLGVMLLMVGNGMHGTLLGIRGDIEGFSTYQMSIIMSAYFVGFLFGSRLAPNMIRRVGHVRVFAALGSFISAILIMFPTLTEPGAWTVGRIMIGFCFSGVYVTAESWLNNAATNETRGQALSLYVIMQMIGIVAAQTLLVTADPSGYVLFVIPSVLVSISFAPILLSISPTPAFDSTKPLSLKELYTISPLGFVGMFLLGGVFSAQFTMASVYGTKVGLSVAQISTFVSAFYVGATICQFPLGWLSDRMDRRLLIILVSVGGAIGGFIGASLGGSSFTMLLVSAFIIGGMSNPLYSLLIAYTNDFLDHDDMAAASGGLVFINGVGAISGPMLTGWIMTNFGAHGYFLFIAAILVVTALYGLYRMTQRAGLSVDDQSSYATVLPTASPVAVEAAQEYAIEAAQEEEDDEVWL